MRYIKLILVIFVITLCSCTKSEEKEMSVEIDREAEAQTLLMEQTMMGVNWMQQSGEYRALAYQAFNAAKHAFDKAETPEGLKKAVVVDLDETMIDNTSEGAERILSREGFTPERWSAWCEAEQALAIPGAVEFAEYVTKSGGKIFYVSNRKVDPEYQSTVNNLKKLGFPAVDETSVLLKEKEGLKAPRFEKAAAQGYYIVVFIGDNLDDFGFTMETYKKLNSDRKAVTDKYKTDFGTKYIILPNPIYGHWEGGLSEDYFKKSSIEKASIRRKSLRLRNTQ